MITTGARCMVGATGTRGITAHLTDTRHAMERGVRMPVTLKERATTGATQTQAGTTAHQTIKRAWWGMRA